VWILRWAGWPGLSTVDPIHTEAAPLSATFGGRGFLRRALRVFSPEFSIAKVGISRLIDLRDLPQIETQAANNRNTRHGKTAQTAAASVVVVSAEKGWAS